MRTKEKRLALVLLLAIGVMLQSISLVANADTDPIVVSSEAVKFIDRSTVLTNGEADIRWKIQFRWYLGEIEDGEVIGFAWQHVRGFQHENGDLDLYGYGVFTSNAPGLGGGFKYFIANKMIAGEVQDFRMYVFGGSGKFLGLRGPVSSPGFPYFHMHMNYNPWE